MSESLKRRLLLVGTCVLLVGSLVCWAWWAQQTPAFGREEVPAPALFPRTFTCPRLDASEAAGFRFERAARLRAERYPYDPEDGVLGVRLFLQARACYQAFGSDADAARSARLGDELMGRVETDYASARLVLREALRRGRSSWAARETARLLAMTRHLGPDPYVLWLHETAGRLSAHAPLLR